MPLRWRKWLFGPLSLQRRKAVMPGRSAPRRRETRCPPAIEELEARVVLNGLTIITHGYNDNIAGWVTAMGNSVAKQANAQGGEAARLVVAGTGVFGTLQVQETSVNIPQDYNGQVILEFDWGDI